MRTVDINPTRERNSNIIENKQHDNSVTDVSKWFPYTIYCRMQLPYEKLNFACLFLASDKLATEGTGMQKALLLHCFLTGLTRLLLRLYGKIGLYNFPISHVVLETCY